MSTKSKLGRPRTVITLPRKQKFTITDIYAANAGHVECRLTIYTCVKRLLRKGKLSKTSETVATGTRGKPPTLFMRKQAKPVKLAALPAVDLVPAVPVAA